MYLPRPLDSMPMKRTLEWVSAHKQPTAAITLTLMLLMGIAGHLYWTTFADVELDETLGEEAVIHASGQCEDGDPGHSCEGTVSIAEVNGTWMLAFEDYDATDGPDVWFYLTKEGHEGETEAVEEDGLLVLVPQIDDGRAEVEGNFLIPLPDSFIVTEWGGLSVWCEDYNILMGSVAFSPVPN